MENLADVAPLAGTLGIEVSRAEAEEVRGGMDWAAERCTAGGVLHGGALMSLADTLGGVCAFLNLPDGATTTATVESKTNFFRAVREGHVDGVSKPLHVGRTLIVAQTDLLGPDIYAAAVEARQQPGERRGGVGAVFAASHPSSVDRMRSFEQAVASTSCGGSGSDTTLAQLFEMMRARQCEALVRDRAYRR